MSECPKPSGRYRLRGFASLVVTVSFLVMLLSGVVLYFTPQGMIAHWTDWTLLGLTKEQWSAVHMAMSLLFFLGAAVHIYLNITPLWCYLRGRAGRLASLWPEALVATLLTVGLAVLAIADLPPASYLLDANDAMKRYWAQVSTRPPVPHAERMTVGQLSRYVGPSPEEIVAALREEGHDIDDASITLGELAEQKGMSAAQVFADLAKHYPEITEKKGHGRGFGFGGQGPGQGAGRGAGGGRGWRGGGQDTATGGDTGGARGGDTRGE